MTVLNKQGELYGGGNWEVYLATYGVEVSMNFEKLRRFELSKIFGIFFVRFELHLISNQQIGIYFTAMNDFITKRSLKIS